MKPHLIFACLTLAGCATPATQTPLNLAATNQTALSKPVPTAFIAGPQNANGQFSVTLGNGEVLTGSYMTEPDPGPATSLAGPVLSNYVHTLNKISMVASSGNDTMRCSGTETGTVLNLTCYLSDGSTYQTASQN